jgi:hypothetical protein
MSSGILFMLTVEKRFETGHQDNSWWCHRDGRIPLGGVEKRFETRHQEYTPRRDPPEEVEPTSQPKQNNLVERLFGWVRPQQACSPDPACS